MNNKTNTSNNNITYSFMAWSVGDEITEVKKISGGNWTKYIGIGAFKLLAINPNKAQLEQILGRTLEKDIEYKIKSNDGAIGARIVFYMKAMSEIDGEEIDNVFRFDFPVYKSARYNRDKSKVQVIDNYGNTAWATAEQVKAKQIPTTKTGNPVFIDANYRPVYQGEENLVNFVKAYLNVADCRAWNAAEKKFGWAEDLSKAQAFFTPSEFELLFQGNANPIHSAFATRKNNLVQVLVGVKSYTDKEGKVRETQDFWPSNFLPGSCSPRLYDNFKRNVERSMEQGAKKNTKFDFGAIHEYVVEPTSFDTPQSTASNSMEIPSIPDLSQPSFDPTSDGGFTGW